MVSGSTRRRCAAGASALVIGLLAIGCGSSKGSAPDKDIPAAAQTGTSTVTGSGTAGAQAPPLASGEPAAPEGPKEIPTFVLERFKTATFNPDMVFVIDGAVVVALEQRYKGIQLGRVVGDNVEPFGGVISNTEDGGRNITDVGGSYPDGVDLYTSNWGHRADTPAVTPITGKGTPGIYPGSPGLAAILGVARVGQTSILCIYDYYPNLSRLDTFRGPPHRLDRQTPAQAGCPPYAGNEWIPGFPAPVAIHPMVFGATRAGTILSVGMLCRLPEGKDKATLGAEIWTGDDPKSKIVDLSSIMETLNRSVRALLGKGDEMWFGSRANEYQDEQERPLLHYKDGHFERVDPPGKRIANIAAAPSGELYVSDGRTIFRRDEGKWTPVARLDWPRTFDNFGVYEGEFWASTNRQVFRLRPGKGVEPRDDCPSPFVYIQDVKPERAATERYPNTAAAIASFPEAADVTFLAFTVADRPSIGVTVKSNAQGKALIEHLRPLLPDTSPRLLCYAPEKPRKLKLPAKTK
ncbi:MAG: hypothetical protein U0441_12570 [Polyangiaceae bacterium]